jgi:3-oxoacyl-[acyl-carrier-protein] synthase II
VTQSKVTRSKVTNKMNKRIYITGTSCISPQKTFSQERFLAEPVDHLTPILSCIEPVYKDHINPVLARRLSRYIKMGVTTALTSLKDAGIEMPGAVITGTGLGSIEDNEKILSAMYEFQERLINPTHFIQSTHNTISSQIAIMLKCHNYNNTYVHRGFSFESALLDGMLLLQEGLAETALIGGVDALTEDHYKNFTLINRWRNNDHGSLKMIEHPGEGIIPGEGSAHFVISSQPADNTYAVIDGIELIYKPASIAEIISKCRAMLDKHGLGADDIDLVLLGNNGDTKTDQYYQDFSSSLFADTPTATFKHLCGEYDTASAFALWLSAMIIKNQTIPPVIMSGNNGYRSSAISHLLIYTHHRGDQHALMLLSKTPEL